MTSEDIKHQLIIIRILPKKKNRSLQVLLLTSKGQNLFLAQVLLAHDTDLPVRCAMNLRTYWWVVWFIWTHSFPSCSYFDKEDKVDKYDLISFQMQYQHLNK